MDDDQLPEAGKGSELSGPVVNHMPLLELIVGQRFSRFHPTKVADACMQEVRSWCHSLEILFKVNLG